MCDCAERTLEQLNPKFLEQLKTEIGFQNIEDIDYKNRIWMVLNKDLSESDTQPPFSIPVQATYTRKAKGSGNVREYKKQYSIIPSFCPMCGEKYKK
jgi:hypothetical protein